MVPCNRLPHTLVGVLRRRSPLHVVQPSCRTAWNTSSSSCSPVATIEVGVLFARVCSRLQSSPATPTIGQFQQAPQLEPVERAEHHHPSQVPGDPEHDQDVGWFVPVGRRHWGQIVWWALLWSRHPPSPKTIPSTIKAPCPDGFTRKGMKRPPASRSRVQLLTIPNGGLECWWPMYSLRTNCM